MSEFLSAGALLFSVAAGYLIAELWLAECAAPAFKLFLAAGLGLGFTASALFCDHYLTGVFHPSLLWALHIGFFAFLVRRACLPSDALAYSGLAALGGALLLFRILKAPYGSGLDVWALWKLKARFLFYPNDLWKNFADPMLNFSCPDYPLLYPLSIVWGWLAAGGETLASQWTIAFLFTFSCVGLLAAALRPYGRGFALGAGLFLLSTPHFIGWGSSFYAEITVTYMNLAAFVLAAAAIDRDSTRFGTLAGVFFGLAAFSKNEGWLFMTACFAGVVLAALFAPQDRRKKMLRRLGEFLLGAVPVLLIVILFKSRVGLPSEKMNVALILNAFEAPDNAQKALVVLRYALEEVMKENAWVYTWFFFLAAFFLYAKRLLRPERLWMLAALVFLQIGYLGAYLVSTVPLESNLATSIDRVLLQGFPAWTFLAFRVWSEPA